MRSRVDYQPYVRELADRMQLRDWTISVVPNEPPGEKALADILRTKGRRDARLRLSEQFLRESEEEQRDTIVHELIHMHGAVVDSFLVDKLNDDWQTFSTLREYETDALAAAVASLMPLPSDILDHPLQPRGQSIMAKPPKSSPPKGDTKKTATPGSPPVLSGKSGGKPKMGGKGGGKKGC